MTKEMFMNVKGIMVEGMPMFLADVYCFPVSIWTQQPPFYRHREAVETLLKNYGVFKVHVKD